MKLKLNINNTITKLLAQEDTDGDNKITIDDTGSKQFLLKDINGNLVNIEGTYHLSNLLQELALANKNNSEIAEIDINEIIEAPVERISRKIKTIYWDGLTRTIDEKGLQTIITDQKTNSAFYYLYVPDQDQQGFDYYKKLEPANPKLKVVKLPSKITPAFERTIKHQAGILALAVENNQAVPFVVPGGRFNEMYGWDSYFISIGLLTDGKIDLAKAIAENFKYQIDHYGKILNANRSYYLSRTQPPFYTSLIIDIIKTKNQEKSWIAKHLKTAIKEYQTVWMMEGCRLTENGLNRYQSEGEGVPFEVETGHFNHILKQYALKYNLSVQEFEQKYIDREIIDAQLDTYFTHDRSMRESGLDTTNGLVDVCANLNTVALNSLLYKYETDIAFLIKTVFDNQFEYKQKIYTSEDWLSKSMSRKEKINTLCWHKTEKMYFDYNFVKQTPHLFESATTFYPLWAKLCDQQQADDLIKNTLPKFKMKAGIASSTKKAIAHIDKDAPTRQWDYPFGWAPHQIMLWQGLLHYGYQNETQEMVYRWLWLITRNAVDYNGTIPEKFNLETNSHKVSAEYGNVGTKFDYTTQEGFGWTNASYQFGLTILNEDLKQKLNDLVDPDDIF